MADFFGTDTVQPTQNDQAQSFEGWGAVPEASGSPAISFDTGFPADGAVTASAFDDFQAPENPPTFFAAEPTPASPSSSHQSFGADNSFGAVDNSFGAVDNSFEVPPSPSHQSFGTDSSFGAASPTPSSHQSFGATSSPSPALASSAFPPSSSNSFGSSDSFATPSQDGFISRHERELEAQREQQSREEQQKKQELEAKAKRELEQFYEERRQRTELLRRQHRDASESIKDNVPENDNASWGNVGRFADMQAAKKDGRSTARMKEILIAMRH